MTFIKDKSNPLRLDGITPNPSSQADLRVEGINYLSAQLDITTAQAAELYAIVESRASGMARMEIWNEAVAAAIAGGYHDRLNYNVFARYYVNLFKGGFFTDHTLGTSGT